MFLKLNPKKTEIMIIRSKKSNISVLDSTVLLDSEIKTSDKLKILGVVFDCHLTMEAHVNNITANCYSELKRLWSIRKFCSIPLCKTLVQAMVTSRLDYCNSLLFNLPQNLAAKLDRVQTACIKFIYKVPRIFSNYVYMQELHWLPVEYRVKFKILTFIFRVSTDMAVLIYMKKMFRRPTQRRSSRNVTGNNFEAP